MKSPPPEAHLEQYNGRSRGRQNSVLQLRLLIRPVRAKGADMFGIEISGLLAEEVYLLARERKMSVKKLIKQIIREYLNEKE